MPLTLLTHVLFPFLTLNLTTNYLVLYFDIECVQHGSHLCDFVGMLHCSVIMAQVSTSPYYIHIWLTSNTYTICVLNYIYFPNVYIIVQHRTIPICPVRFFI